MTEAEQKIIQLLTELRDVQREELAHRRKVSDEAIQLQKRAIRIQRTALIILAVVLIGALVFYWIISAGRGGVSTIEEALCSRRMRTNMNMLQGTIVNGQIVLDTPTVLPEGTRVEVLPIADVPNGLGMREDDWPTTPEEIAALVARMDQVEPGWLSPEDDAAWRQRPYGRSGFERRELGHSITTTSTLR